MARKVIANGERHAFCGKGSQCMQIVMNRMGQTSRCRQAPDHQTHIAITMTKGI